jgi:hypothetical protein
MQTSTKPGYDWTVQLRRRPDRIVAGRPEGGHAEVFEIICRDCGDDPGLDYREVSPELQQIRGAYTLRAGVEAYLRHADRHRPGPRRDVAEEAAHERR